MKVLTTILIVFLGAVGAAGASAAPAPSASASTIASTTTTDIETQAQDRFERPPHAVAHVAVVAKLHPKAHKAAVRPAHAAVVRTHTATRARVRTFAVVAGIRPSAYRGAWYDPRWESFRLCVINRESHGNYAARNPYSSASGAYQFLANWTSTIQGWTGEHVPIWQMSRWAQDYAWFRAMDHGKGLSAWRGGNYYCGF